MNMTKAEIKAKWLEELRSGKHLQVKGTLVLDTDGKGTLGYCCLGVLHNHVLGSNVTPVTVEAVKNFNTESEGPQSCYRQCEDILGHWVFNDCDGDFKSSGMNYLTSLNDEYDNDFNQIADEIEKKWKVD